MLFMEIFLLRYAVSVADHESASQTGRGSCRDYSKGIDWLTKHLGGETRGGSGEGIRSCLHAILLGISAKNWIIQELGTVVPVNRMSPPGRLV